MEHDKSASLPEYVLISKKVSILMPQSTLPDEQILLPPEPVWETELPVSAELPIRDKLLPLPPETVVIPGHGDNTTIGRERQFNPFLHF